MDKPDLTFAYCKHLWHEGKQVICLKLFDSATFWNQILSKRKYFWQDLALTQLKILVDTALKSAVLQRCEIQEQQELVKLKAKSDFLIFFSTFYRNFWIRVDF